MSDFSTRRHQGLVGCPCSRLIHCISGVSSYPVHPPVSKSRSQSPRCQCRRFSASAAAAQHTFIPQYTPAIVAVVFSLHASIDLEHSQRVFGEKFLPTTNQAFWLIYPSGTPHASNRCLDRPSTHEEAFVAALINVTQGKALY